jgi:hypothetical protein
MWTESVMSVVNLRKLNHWSWCLEVMLELAVVLAAPQEVLDLLQEVLCLLM